jgi:hypothetical protein
MLGSENVMNAIANILAGLALITGFVNSGYQYYKDRRKDKFEQADKISAWLAVDDSGNIVRQNGLMTVVVRNFSQQPVYNTIVSSGTYQGAGQPYLKGSACTSSVGTIPPGTYITSVPYPGVSMHIQIEAAIAFTDAKHVSWLRNAERHLQKIDDPRMTFEIDLPPCNWQPVKKAKS